MKVVPLSSKDLRVGRPLPYTLRDQLGGVLLPRGAPIETKRQLALLQARPLFIDQSESEIFKRAYAGQLDEMVRQELLLGRIADARLDFEDMLVPGVARAPERPLDWPNLQMRLRMLLVSASGADWLARLRSLRDDVLALARRHEDRALMRLIHQSGDDFQDYGATHSLLVCVLAALTGPQLPDWQPAWAEPLTLAALTMNFGFSQLQDELARQTGALTEHQRAVVTAHPERAAQRLAEAGVDDPMWLHAVLHHHDVPAGPLAGRAPADMIARLICRADRYAARLSPRRSRPASSVTTAAQAILLDEGGQADDAGRALVRTLGLYPPGAWVKLQCGEVALVLRRTAVAKAPTVVSLVGRTGLPLAAPALRNARLPEHAVAGAVAPAQVKVRPNLDALEKL